MSGGDIFEHRVDHSGSDVVRRLDVIVSSGGRRKWAPDVKARIIAESMAPGANVAEVARRNDMQPQHLYLWRRTAAERMADGGRDHPAFVPVRVEEAPMRATPVAPTISDACASTVCSPEISIELDGMMLRIPDGVNVDHIERVLLAVRAAS